MYIVGRKSDESLVEQSGLYGSGNPDEITVLNNVILRYGGVSADYSVKYFLDNSTEAERLANGDEYTMIWISTSADKYIDDVDFSIEDSKNWLRVTSTKNTISGDGVDETRIRFRAYTPDLSGVDESYNEIKDIPISTPNNGTALLSVEFVSGIGIIDFASTTYGKWKFPEPEKRIDSLRISKVRRINVRIDI